MRSFAIAFALATASLLFPLGEGNSFAQDSVLAPRRKVDRLISQLDDDSFIARTQARDELISLSDDTQTESIVISALRAAKKSPKLEVHESVNRLLFKIDAIQTQRQLVSLIEPSTPAESITLPFWKRFSSMAGTDLEARQLFAKTFRRYPAALQLLESCAERATRFAGKAVATTSNASRAAKLAELLDPYSIESDDAALWAILFCADDPALQLGLSGLSSRTTLALTQTGRGPNIALRSESNVIRRMIGHWVTRDRGTGLNRERLLIALKFGCNKQAAQLCDETLQNRFAAPSAHAMALLSASVLQRPDLEQQLMLRIGDQRTAHVWQLIASRKTKIRTQVGDVALALLLHHHGVDPRTIGFEELQADPLTVFREHSLGFCDEPSRQAAFQAAKNVIPLATQ